MKSSFTAIMILAFCSSPNAFFTDPTATIEPSRENDYLYFLESITVEGINAGILQPSTEQIFTYSGTHLRSAQSRTWDNAQHTWSTSLYTEYFYDSLNRTTVWYSSLTQDDTSSSFQKQAYTYNDFGKMSHTVIYQRKDNAWVGAYSTYYTYDSNRRLIKQVGRNLQDAEPDSNIIQYSYPDDTTYTMTSRQIIKGVAYSSTTQTLHITKNWKTKSSTSSMYYYDTLYITRRSVSKYNDNERLTQIIDEQFKNGKWSIANEYNYTYSEYSDSMVCNLISLRDTGTGLYTESQLRTKYIKQFSPLKVIRGSSVTNRKLTITAQKKSLSINSDCSISQLRIFDFSGNQIYNRTSHRNGYKSISIPRREIATASNIIFVSVNLADGSNHTAKIATFTPSNN